MEISNIFYLPIANKVGCFDEGMAVEIDQLCLLQAYLTEFFGVLQGNAVFCTKFAAIGAKGAAFLLLANGNKHRVLLPQRGRLCLAK